MYARTGDIRIRREREDVELVLPVTCTFENYGAYVITLEIAEEVVASRILRVSPTVAGARGASGNGAGS